MNAKPANAATRKTLLRDIRGLIEQTRSAVAITVNAGLTMLYWHIGQRINAEILKGKRAGYGDEIVAALGRQLTEEYGSGFEEKNLRRMLQFVQAFQDVSIGATLSRQLSWSHFKELLPVAKPLPSVGAGANGC